MASIQVDRQGYLFVQFRFNRILCREYLRLRDTRDNRKTAKRIAADIELAQRAGKFDYAERFPNSKALARVGAVRKKATPTLAEFATFWLSEQPMGEAARKNFGYIFGTFLDKTALGAMLVDKVTSHDIHAVASAGKSYGDTMRFLRKLRAVFEMAIDDGLVARNPAAKVNLPRPTGRRADPTEPLTAQERDALINAATGQDRALIVVRLGAGLRPSESLYLRRQDIDFERKLIVVAGGVVRGKIGPGKNEGAYRVVEMSDAIAPVTAALTELLADGRQDHIFKDRFGKHLSHASWSQEQWTRIVKRAGIPFRPANVLRHTYAVAMLEAGYDAVHVARQMGHTSTEMLHRNYARWKVTHTNQPESKTL